MDVVSMCCSFSVGKVFCQSVIAGWCLFFFGMLEAADKNAVIL